MGGSSGTPTTAMYTALHESHTQGQHLLHQVLFATILTMVTYRSAVLYL